MKNYKKFKAAFFDVDNTILNIKTMFSFVEYCFRNAQINFGFDNYEEFKFFIKKHSVGASRDQVNRVFYRCFSGQNKADIQDAADKWFRIAVLNQRSTVFNATVLEVIKILRHEGFIIVAVSGSFKEILNPLIEYLALDDCLATELIVNNDCYSGDIERSLIGAGKSEAIRQYALKNNITLDSSVACGDHISDLPMLEIVGQAYVVGGDDKLETIATSRQWPIIAGHAAFSISNEIHS